MSSAEISPYIDSNETLNYKSPRALQDELESGMHIRRMHSDSTLPKKPDFWIMPSIGVIIAILVIIIILIVYFKPSLIRFEGFLSASQRDDLGGDSDSDCESDSSSMLEKDIEKLYKMQKRNIDS